MPIDATEFGSITIEGKTYDHDVIIRLSGRVEKRRKRLSKEQYGTSHVISKAEAKFVFEKGCDLLIVGAGQEGNVRMSPEASGYFDKKHCRVVIQRTPEAILTFNRSATGRARKKSRSCTSLADARGRACAADPGLSAREPRRRQPYAG